MIHFKYTNDNDVNSLKKINEALIKENSSRIKMYRKLKKIKTLTTQVVRKSNFKKKRSASSRVPVSKLSKGHGRIS